MSSQFTAYSAFYGPAQSALEALSNILKRGQQDPNAASLPSARLCEDMKPLTFQIYAVCNTIDRMVSRTTGADRTPFREDLTTFEDMHAQIETALALVASASADLVNQRANTTVALPSEGGGTEDVPIHLFMTGFNLPNLFFHVSIAYAILRKEGVPLGKDDYMASFSRRMVPSK